MWATALVPLVVLAAQAYSEHSLPISVLEKMQEHRSAYASVSVEPDGIHFAISEPLQGMTWAAEISPPLSLRDTPVLIVDYRATGVKTITNEHFIFAAPSHRPLLSFDYQAAWLSDLITDGRWHQLVAPLPGPTLEELATLEIHVLSEETAAEVVIRSIKFATCQPSTQTMEDTLPNPERPLLASAEALPLDLSGKHNVAVSQIKPDLPVRDFRFAQKDLVAAGVPFIVSTDERNSMAADGAVGTSAITIPAMSRAPSEAYLLLAADFPRVDEHAYGGSWLLRIWHPHRMSVDVQDADGTSETFFPLRVLSLKPEVMRGLDVYVVPVRGQPVELRVNDRMRLGKFGVCAVTLNTGTPRFDLSLWTPKNAAALESPDVKPKPSRPKEAQASQLGENIVLENADLRVAVQIQPTVLLSELRLLPVDRNTLVEPVPLFNVASWDGEASATSADYQLASHSVEGSEAMLVMLPPTKAFPEVEITLRIDEQSACEVQANLRNTSDQAQRWLMSLPAKCPFRIGDSDVYTYPHRNTVISSAENHFGYRYCGWGQIFQYMDVSDPSLGMGLCLLTKDLTGFDRISDLKRKGQVTTMDIRWRTEPVAPGESLPLPSVEFAAHRGNWRGAYDHYKAWTETWYRPIAPRKDWFRRVFALWQDYIGAGLFDSEGYHFAERVEEVRELFGACDYLHIFDWGATSDRGRVGDYDPWNNRLTSSSEFREAAAAMQGQGVPVGLYIEGYLVDNSSRIGKAHRQDWGLRKTEGETQLWEPGSSEFVMCPGVKGWRDYLTGVYQRVEKETKAIGYYIDEFGVGTNECFAESHDHPPERVVLPYEGQVFGQVREALPPECALYTENFPPDIFTSLLDGSFDYSVCNYHQMISRWISEPDRWVPVPLRLGRFVFPDFKVLQIVFWGAPQGTNEEAYKQVFFNGDGYFLQGRSETWEPETLETLRKCISILREHADGFSGDDCEPLVPTLVRGLFANRFASASKTVWTLYNANWRSLNEEVLAVPYIDGARYVDAWNGGTLTPRIVDDMAYLRVALAPHGVGCIYKEAGQ